MTSRPKSDHFFSREITKLTSAPEATPSGLVYAIINTAQKAINHL